MKKLVIFDFDGTLFDTVDDVIICFNEALEINGFPTLTKDEYLDRLGGNMDEIVSLILKDKNTAENMELIKKTSQEVYSQSPKDRSHPFSNIHDILKALDEKGIVLAINSNRNTDSIRYFTDKFFSDINFIDIKGHDFSNPSKPMPYGTKKIMRKAKISKEETIFIGDTLTDIKTAKNAEIDCILVSWGYGRKEAFESDYPLKIIDDPNEILDII